MSYTFKPHSNDTIYNTIFSAYAKGLIDLDLNANMESIQKMEAMKTDDFVNMFKETLDTKYGIGTEDRRNAEANLRHRHRALRETYRTFYTKLISERVDAIYRRVTRDEMQKLTCKLDHNHKFVFLDEGQRQTPQERHY